MTDHIHIDDQGRKFLVVSTAKQAPVWVGYLSYAVIGLVLIMGHNGERWPLYALGIIAAGMSYLFHSTYSAVVSLYNQVKVNAAIAKAQAQDMVPSPDDTTIIDRFAKALTYIHTKATEIGDVRDVAWRALHHEAQQETLKEHGNGKEAK